MMLLCVFVVLIFLQSLVSGRLERSLVTAPMVFTAAGAACFLLGSELQDREGAFPPLLRVAEIGLVMLLFADASRTDLRVLRSMRSLPARLLTVGMLLTILLGGLGALVVFPGLSVWEAGILAAILAPTDAGLGQVIVNDSRVPVKIRQALNVEAGLNDGLSVPFLLFFMALAAGGAGGPEANLWRHVVEQLGLGSVVGAGVGGLGGWLLGLAHRRRWSTPSWQQLGVVALPLLCLLVSDRVGASMFIAAFIAGLSVQLGFREVARHSIELTEEWGRMFNLFVFFLFGLLVARSWPQLNARHMLYAALSLTVVRILPVAMALVGTRLGKATVTFLGWFGPRGLASIVLGLIYLEEEGSSANDPTIQHAVMATVLLSIVAHGLSAMPGLKLYARRLGSYPPNAPELLGSDETLGVGSGGSSLQTPS